MSLPETDPIVLIVAADTPRQRLDVYLAAALPGFSRSRLQQLIRSGDITRNGGRARTRDMVRPGDTLKISEPPLQKIDHGAEDIALSVLHEDDDLIVINKPAGLVVHPGAGHRDGTLVNALLHHCSNLSGIGGDERPGIVHRLDKETSGCMVVAKNDQTHRGLAAQFADRTVSKTYLALALGKLRRDRGTIDAGISRHTKDRQKMAVSDRGRAARTDYRVVRSNAHASLVACQLHSGRTHQIRVHLHHLGHPVAGDKVYGARSAKAFPRQMLHAWKLEFIHPRSGQPMRFEAPLPNDFVDALATVDL